MLKSKKPSWIRTLDRRWNWLFILGLVGADPTWAGMLQVPKDFATVQAALTAAQPGDTILLAPGVYPESVASVRSGTADQRIILDGQGQATLRQFTFRHSYITVQNLTLTGVTQAYSRLVYFNHGGHFGVLSNCVLDVAKAPKVYGVEWRAPRNKPFGDGEAASHCLVISNEVRNVVGITMLSVMGDSNRIVGNFVHDGGAVDFFRLFGRNNYIGYNVCSNNYIVEGIGNHPDFIQTFGNNGDGSMGHIIEANWVIGVYGGQLTQLEGNLVPAIRDWTFQNNVFVDIALQASCTIPEVKYYNNLFFRCNKTNKGHALYFGSRYYVSTYDGRSGTNYAHGGRVINNVFLECGDDRIQVGWYWFDQQLTNVVADYNYVAKPGFMPVEQDLLRRPIGNADGWATWGKWWEPSGINGGDPLFWDLSHLNFRLHDGSPLIGRGMNLGDAFRTDIWGRVRALSWDIGPYAFYVAPPGREIPAPHLRVVYP